MKRMLLAWCILGATSWAALAGPVDLQRVPHDAKWLLHIDFAAAKQTQLAQAIHQRWLMGPAAQRSLREAREKTGLDLLGDLVGLTFYGRSYRPADGVLIIEATGGRARLTEFLQQQAEYRASQYRGHPLHIWTDKKGQPDEHPLVGVLYGDRLVILGRTEALVSAAIDVLEGRAASLAGDVPLLEGVPAGAAVVLAARDFSGDDAPFKSPVLRQSERLALALGEERGETFLRGEVVARSDEAAQQIKSIVEGMAALARMQFAEDAAMLAVLRPLLVAVVGPRVTVQWQGPGREALTQLQRALETRGAAPVP